MRGVCNLNSLKYIGLVYILIMSAAAAYGMTNEAMAPWERTSDSQVWGETIVEKALTGEGSGLKLNAFCDEGSFRSAAAWRSIAVDGISEPAGSEIRLWAMVLANSASIGVNGADKKEHGLIALAWMSSIGGFSKPSAMSGANNNGGKVLLDAAPAASTCRVEVKTSVQDTAVNHITADQCSAACARLNMTDYRTDADKVDRFALFLYLWNDIPGEHNTITSPFLPIKAFPVFFTIYHHNNQTTTSTRIYCARNGIGMNWHEEDFV